MAEKEKTKEIKKEKQEKSERKVSQENKGLSGKEELEDELEEESLPESFGNFLQSRFAPIFIPSSQSSAERRTIEEDVADAPARQRTKREEDGEKKAEYRIATAYDASTSYSSAQYQMAEYEQRVSPLRQEMARTGILIRQDEFKDIKPTVEMEEWHELRSARQAGAGRAEEPVMHAEVMQRETKLPFEEKKYRGRRI